MTVRQSTRACVATGHAWSRVSPSANAPFAGEHLFNEELTILDPAQGWVQVRSLLRSDPSWLPRDQIFTLEDISGGEKLVCTARASYAYNEPDLLRPAFRISMGTSISVVETKLIDAPNNIDRVSLGRDASGFWFSLIHFSPRGRFIDPAESVAKFIGVPYRHLGRSSEGVDSLGLVQIIFQTSGFSTPDYLNQMKDTFGRHVGALTDVSIARGDIIFFGDLSGIIVDKNTVVYSCDDAAAVVISDLTYVLNRRRLAANEVAVKRIG